MPTDISKAVVIRWTDPEKDPALWDATHVLFAFLHPRTNAILYIGCAGCRTVALRYNANEMKSFWTELDRREHLEQESVKIIVGQFNNGSRWGNVKQQGVELHAFLIGKLKPWGNNSEGQSKAQ